MSGKSKAEYCGDCLLRFAYADWPDPVAELVKHKTTCAKAKR